MDVIDTQTIQFVLDSINTNKNEDLIPIDSNNVTIQFFQYLH